MKDFSTTEIVIMLGLGAIALYELTKQANIDSPGSNSPLGANQIASGNTGNAGSLFSGNSFSFGGTSVPWFDPSYDAYGGEQNAINNSSSGYFGGSPNLYSGSQPSAQQTLFPGS